MAKNYRYRLGIDLGTDSLGTALVRCDADGTPLGILDAGVRLFNISEGAAERRQARQARKVIRRRHQRMTNLKSLLHQHGLLPPAGPELARLMRRTPYLLRARAAQRRLESPYEVGRCLLHLARFRGAGFLTQQEDLEEDTPQKDRQKSADTYRNLEKILKERHMTVGEFFAERLRRADTTKGRIRRRKDFLTDGSVDFAVPRFLVKEEFARIWETQAPFFPQMTDELRKKIYNTIFKDKPHAPYAVGTCSLDPDNGGLRIPRMSRLADTRRIYEQVNNLRIRTRTAEFQLTREMRDTLVEKCMQGNTLKKSDIKRILQPFCEERILAINLADDKSIIKGFCLASAFKNIPAWNEMSEKDQDDLLAFMAEPLLDPENPRKLLMPEDEFLAECIRRLRLEHMPDAEALISRCLHELPRDRSMLGETATRRILEKLREGEMTENGWQPVSHRQAADACGYLAEEKLARVLGGRYDKLPYYGEILRHDVAPVHPWHKDRATEEEAKYGRFPNPVVHVALNQLRKVVNEIIDLYGKPMSIHVELAREFGMSAEKRDQLVREQKERERKNKAIDEELIRIGLPPSRRNRIKYRLWEEQAHQDIYTLRAIAATDLASCDIDHIIPQALGGSDTYANLTLTFKDVNLAKGESAAYDFIQQRSPDAWPHILEFISDAKKYPPNKAWRFKENAKGKFLDGDEDQTDHRLTDTSYMAKMAKRYLWCLCKDIVPLRGGMTAKLRHMWGLDGLEYQLMGLNIPRDMYDAETGEVILDDRGYPARNPKWKAKPRIDQRHHAQDAIVLACTSRAMMQRLAHDEKRGIRSEDFPAPFGKDTGTFRAEVLQCLDKVKPSPKAEHSKEGRLHEATRYRILAELPGKTGLFLCTYNRKLSAVTKLDAIKTDLGKYGTIPEVAAIAEKNALKRALAEQQFEKARQNLELRQQDSLKKKTPDEKTLLQEAFRLAQKHDPRMGYSYKDVPVLSLVNVDTKTQSGYKPGGNFCVDFFEKKDGKVGWECIKLFDANQQDFKPDWEKAGYTLIWRLFKDDVLELQFSEEEKKKLGLPPGNTGTWFRVQKFSDGALQMKLLQDARPLQGKENESICWVSGENGLNYFTKAQARKVELSPFGKVIRKHKKLWDGKKTKKA